MTIVIDMKSCLGFMVFGSQRPAPATNLSTGLDIAVEND
jgi:hypothetical protein